MDTPEKTQIPVASRSKFEDSPVFNYINSLSPIRPLKSIPITQSFNPLCFPSLPSVFTSPHLVTSSHKESRFLIRHNNYTDLSKNETSSQNEIVGGGGGEGDKLITYTVAPTPTQLYDNSPTLPPHFHPNMPTQHSNELPGLLKYHCGSPDFDDVASPANQTQSQSNLVDDSTEDASSQDCLGTCQTEHKNESTGCDWDTMLTDAADLLFFNSPADSEALKALFKSPFQPTVNVMLDVPRMLQSQQIETGDQSSQSDEALNQKQGSIATTTQNPTGSGNDENGFCIPFAGQPESNLQRGLRRRCLDFEMAGARKRNSNNASNGNILSKDKQVVPTMPHSDSSKSILSGIGLHLNALAIAPRDNKTFKNESFTSTNLEQFCESFPSASAEIGTEPAELAEDSSQPEEFNQNSPKKKRRRMEQAGESDSSCKRCNCKKSKCLKLYCECFAAGVYCVEPCACQDCFNKPIHEDTVLATRKQIESRNPLAFAPKVIRGPDSAPEIRDDYSKTPASARHKRGCNCKKSSCLKKYCECYQGGVGCSVNCRCEGCKNAFGRKDGSVPTETEEADDDETETGDMDKAVQNTEIPTKEPRNLASAFPITPLQLSRPLVKLPFSSTNKPSLLAVGSSSSMLYNGQKYGKPNIIRSQFKVEKQLQTVPENEMPEILQETRSPITGVKTASPNSKRITPPYYDLGTSPGLKSSRKLILQSIPSFPSLTPKH
ncbi:hypothetical protein ACFE04_005929 [Oxalis oulophora]